MSALPQISEAEYEVMKVVWKHAPINTNEITEKLLKTSCTCSFSFSLLPAAPFGSYLTLV